MKENITNLTDCLAKIIQLQGLTYTWKKLDEEGYSIAQDDATYIGLLAQDVEAVFPLLVKNDSTNDHFADEYTNDDGEVVPAVEKRYKSLNYSGLIPILIEGVKELAAKVKVLEDA